MRRMYRAMGYTSAQLKNESRRGGNPERPSDGHLSKQEAATVDITPHHTPFVPTSVIPATTRDGTFHYMEVR